MYINKEKLLRICNLEKEIYELKKLIIDLENDNNGLLLGGLINRKIKFKELERTLNSLVEEYEREEYNE